MFRAIGIVSCLCLLLAPPEVFGYAYLSEYLSSDGNTLRSSGSSGEDDDVLRNPKWSGTIDVVLCTGGTAIQAADINPGGDFNDWTDELLDETNAALNTWKNAGSGTSLSISTATKSGACGPDLGQAYGGNDGVNRLFFNNRFEDGSAIPSGVIAFTVLSLEADDGNLRIVDADIIFNVNEEFDYQGVLTHELGHFLGIAHSPITDDNSTDGTSTAATMFPAISGSGASLAILVTDDELAIQNLYPEGSTKGEISGKVFRADGTPQRGAHITAFAVDSATSLAGVFSSLSKTRAGYDGSYSLKRLPLNTDFILFVEPAHRPDIHPNFIYSVFNTPIQQALQLQEEGYRTFAVEAYPDVKIVDIRETRDVSVSPGIDDAEVFRLTSDNKTRSGINFYLSQEYEAPNDAVNTDLSINPNSESSLLINNANPVQLFIEIPTDLSVFEDPELSLSAKFGSKNYNWSNTIPSFNFETKSALITIALPSPAPQNGSYELTFKLEDPKYGSYTATRDAIISDWTFSEAKVILGDGSEADETSGGGGGGCSLYTSGGFSWSWLIGFLGLMGVLLLGRKPVRSSSKF